MNNNIKPLEMGGLVKEIDIMKEHIDILIEDVDKLRQLIHNNKKALENMSEGNLSFITLAMNRLVEIIEEIININKEV